ncbi:MAG: electron transfer flavoprotein subunit alpha/FixB family protein [Acidimicrobiales bacterium]
MTTLVFLEHHGEELQKGSLGVLAKAAALEDGEVAALLVGAPGVSGLAAVAARFGAGKVYVAEDASLDPPLPQPRVDVIAEVVRLDGIDTILLSNSVLAADIAAALAARLDAGLNWDLVDIAVRDGELVGKRMALGDSVLVEVGWRSATRVALMRAGTFEASEKGSSGTVVEVEPHLEQHSSSVRVVEQRVQPDSGPSLEDAEVIVSGGMGLGGPEKFSLAEGLASALGGVVGATRAAVYAGWYPHSAQVGQTGKTVAPNLYVALGISGAVQHKVGMQSSKVIVSINTDASAPIFEFSDLAVVGDVHTIVPKLIELIEQRKSS